MSEDEAPSAFDVVNTGRALHGQGWKRALARDLCRLGAGDLGAIEQRLDGLVKDRRAGKPGQVDPGWRGLLLELLDRAWKEGGPERRKVIEAAALPLARPGLESG